MPIQFLYFDLGKVLVNFDVKQMCRQVADTAGTTTERVAQVLFEEHLQREFELGHLDERGFYEAFSKKTNTRADYDRLAVAASDFFELNVPIVPLVASLQLSGRRLGILSNTCSFHWEHCRSRFRIVADAFGVHTLSYEVGVAKPDPKIYELAARRAGFGPPEIFFVDDIQENVTGARAAGFDAVLYTSTGQLAADLRARGISLHC